MVIYLLLFLLMSSVAGSPSQDKSSLEVVSAVDINRYAGTWYEIARLPNRF